MSFCLLPTCFMFIFNSMTKGQSDESKAIQHNLEMKSAKSVILFKSGLETYFFFSGHSLKSVKID